MEHVFKGKKIKGPPAKAPPEPPLPEHPEDKAFREEGERYGAKHAQAFCDEHRADFARLIGTYADSDARDLLDNLREKFWAQLWKPSAP